MNDSPLYGRPIGPEKVKAREAGYPSQQAEPGGPLLFSREDWSLYTSLATLPQRAGVTASMLPWLVAKEFCDNALDAADAAGRPGMVKVSVDHHGNLTVEDDGTGIPGATPEQLAGLFCVVRPMVSSKLLRRPSRGAVGNGLRVCIGYLTAILGRLIIETGDIRVELVPEIDGTSRIAKVETIKPRQGLRLIAVAADGFQSEHLAWAEDAIELARQSGVSAFTGRPSAHWMDLDHIRVLLRAALGNVSVRQFLSEFDGCTGSRAQTRIAAQFLRRPAASLDVGEAAQLLAAAQAATKPPKPKALCPLGRDAVVSAGYAIAEGSFAEGQHEPRAHIPFLIECWADGFFPEEQEDPLTSTLYMNRTRALVSCNGQVWHGRLDLSISGTAIQVPAPPGPRYSITINITSPMFRLISDGKAPDCRPFREAMGEAVGKAAARAGRDIAAQMSAEQKQHDANYQHQQRERAEGQRLSEREAKQQRLALIEEEKARRKALPTIRDVVLKLLPGAVEIEAKSGFLFNTRRLLYRIRDEVLRRTGKELIQSYFDNLVTEIEAARGDLHTLLIREARGNFRIPHHLGGQSFPLGTLNVRQFRRPAWVFNKIVTIEKEDLRLMLEQAQWDQRHDALLMSSKGFNSRAARDLIDAIAGTSEPVRVFSVHDADAAGTLIQHTLQHATLARGARLIEVVDLGLQPWEGIALELAIEKVPVQYNKDRKPKRRPVGEYVRERTDQAPGKGETWEAWLQHSRVELNALTSAELIDWLDRKMIEHGAGKLIPPDDILADQFNERARDRVNDAVASAIANRRDALVASIQTEETAARKPHLAELDRVSAPLLTELNHVRAPLLEQMRMTSEPFRQRIGEVQAKAEAIDREAEVHQAIERMRPDAENLRAAIAGSFTSNPTRRWSNVLEEITDETKVAAIKIDMGGPSPPRPRTGRKRRPQ